MQTFISRLFCSLCLFSGAVFAQAPAFANTGAEALAQPEKEAAPQVMLKTSMGDMIITLYPEKAPRTVENFLSYVDDGFYDNSIFHRVVPGFVIQGGGFNTSMSRKQTKAPIVNESIHGLANRRGTLSMARTQNPDSATSQFFINLKNNPSLNASFNRPGYAVFGKVTEGLAVMDMISRVKTGKVKRFRDVPLEPIVILSALRVTAAK